MLPPSLRVFNPPNYGGKKIKARKKGGEGGVMETKERKKERSKLTVLLQASLFWKSPRFNLTRESEVNCGNMGSTAVRHNLEYQ